MQSKVHKISTLSEKDLERYANTTSLQLLANIKLYLDDKYYNSGEDTGISDWKYDILVDQMKKRGYKVPVGAKLREGENRVQLPFWMGSMNKFKPGDEKDIERWLERNPAKRYIVEDKLDGVSCLIVSKGGKIKMYTRGDGYIGADISHLVPYIPRIPRKKDYIVRGELIMDVIEFGDLYSETYANPRNAVAGLIGAKTARAGIEGIEFIAYELITDKPNKSDAYSTAKLSQSPSEQFQYLETLGFNVVQYSFLDNDEIDVTNLSALLLERKNSHYEIDGLIVQPDLSYIRNTSGNPDYAFAFKMTTEGDIAVTEVVEVEWNISKRGILKPRVKLQPVKLGGVIITYATGFNGKFIESNNIGPGALVKITRSGDVIPFIVGVEEPADAPEMPTIPYTWNDTRVEIYATEAGSIKCVKMLSSFFSTMGIKHVSEATVNKLYNNGYDNLLKILEADVEDFERIDTFGKKLAERTYNNIHNGLQNISLPKLLGAFNVFGYGIGPKRVESLFNGIGGDYFTLYISLPEDKFLEKVLSIDGFGDKTGKLVVKNTPVALAFYNMIKPFATFASANKTESNNLEGKQFVVTGFRDKALEETITSRGGKMTSAVSKKTDGLIVADKSGKATGKRQKAESLGIPVYTKEEFISEFLD